MFSFSVVKSLLTHQCKFIKADLPNELTPRSIYQFLIAVRQQDGQMLMNESGDVTR